MGGIVNSFGFFISSNDQLLLTWKLLTRRLKITVYVIPAKTGHAVKLFALSSPFLDPGLRRDDERVGPVDEKVGRDETKAGRDQIYRASRSMRLLR